MTHGMVCAPQPEAVEAGVLALKSGGNAVDAAIACALVQTAVDPQMCGIAGFGSMQLYLPSRGEHTFIDFHGRAPKATREDMWAHLVEAETEDGFGFILEGRVNDIGYQSITTPGSLMAYAEALSRFGTQSLGDLIQPAIRYCEDGFIVRPHVAYYWNLVEQAGRVPHIERLKRFPATAKIYLEPDGSVRKAGELHTNPDMGRTYRRIADAGAEDFYRGEIAHAIDSDMKANDALLCLEDLTEYRTEPNEPLWGEYRGHRIATNRLPGGGAMVLEMLNILEHFDLAAMGHNSARYIATLVEAMKIATVDKDEHMGDPRFVDVPLERLLSADYASEMARRIERGEKTIVPRYRRREESKDTTHVCAVDEHGNCVSLTHSLGTPSGVVTEGLGFMYNGCMGVFDPRPGNADSLAPGKSRFTAMSPTIVFKDDAPALVIGAPGGTFITMGVLQGILNAIDFRMDAFHAVSAPRFCATSDVIDLSNRIPRFVEADLNDAGYETRRTHLSYHFAGVHAIRLTEDGWDGGADPGRDGMALEA
jgi:gamma-glutamyltranspeptidase/glutathione hydrolase